MPSYLAQTWEKVARFWSDRTMAQRVLVAGLATSVILAFFVMVYFLNQTDYKVLYSNLGPEDAAKVVEALKADKINFKLENGGTTVLVPADIVYEKRLQIAGEGNLVGSGIGYEIFDELKVGQTDFVQHINYQRALQGELARTISEFPEVEKARIHLVLPSKSLFIEEQRPATASVVLTLVKGKKLNPKQVQGIVNLVAMSVEGLSPDNITVTDTTGQILFQPKGTDTIDGMTSTQLEYKTNLESTLENRIEQLLTPIIGPGRSIAKVNADLDFNQRTIRKEMYDPDVSVVRSEQRSEESARGSAAVDAANAGTGAAAAQTNNFQNSGFSGTESTSQTTRETRTTNFELNKEEQNIVTAVGDINRLSVAVIVDGTYEQKEGTSEYTFIPRNAEELARIKQIVANAVGMDTARGDSVDVSSFSFGEPDIYVEPSLMAAMLEYAQRLGKPFLNGLLIFLFLILVVRPVVLALIRPRVAEEDVETLERLPEGERRIALAEPEEEELGLMETSKRLDNAKLLAQQLFESNMDQGITVLKTWLKQEAA
ncbi:flagellar basal-body MS-ring/collar protein FliF [Desulfovibrio inopinatus]|uniref:flagellar basal-body MS-ring/collar protein FliF n=1 Tax=Desulfovibrio inopinatus TaxID=102109 RepID=UPI000403A92F|nr:flagellar basal-body MS-ring/collar protein FliF [Desulfovibrio inopinatus]